MKTLIENYVKQNNLILDFLNRSSNLYQEGNEVIPAFVEKLKETQFNPALGNSFAELLQLSENEAINSQFELVNISELYASLIKVQEANIDNYIEAGYFEFSIMDNPVKAKDIATLGLEIAKQKVAQLEILLSTISEQ
jgi:hypothetical protein